MAKTIGIVVVADLAAKADGVSQVDADNRDAGRRLLGRQDARSGGSHDHIGLEPDQLFRQRRQAGRIAVGVAILDPVIAAFQVAKFSHT